MADSLAQLDPLSSGAAIQGDVVLSKKRIQETMSGTYLEFLAAFTKSEEGYRCVWSASSLNFRSLFYYRLLERFKIFTLIYHLTDLQSREDITIGFIERCSYHM